MAKIEFRPRRLGHVNLFVGQLERSIEFYKTICGIELTYLEAGIRAGFHSNGNTHHDIAVVEISKGADRFGRDGKLLIAAARGANVGLNHLGWEMESEVDLVAACKRMRDQNYKPLRHADHVITHSTYIGDPDGNVHEFYADAIPDWRQVFNLTHESLLTSDWDPFAAAPNTTPYYPKNPKINRVSEAPLQTVAVSGATLASSRFDEMRRFLIDVGGLDCVEKPNGKMRKAVFKGRCGRHDITLIEVSPGEKTGLRHFTFLVDPSMDFKSAADRLASIGISDARLASDQHALVLKDPDGFEMEFTRPISDKDTRA